jgi:protein gp37
MIDIEKGRYWDEGIKLVSGCTKCSPGCDHCWSLGMEKRFGSDGKIVTHPGRLARFATRKAKVFAIWNDLFHEDVPDEFYSDTVKAIMDYSHNTYLLITKRPSVLLRRFDDAKRYNLGRELKSLENVFFGLTVCNQQEWNEKKKYFQIVPGKKFLSLEPLLGDIDLKLTQPFKEPFFSWPDSEMEHLAKIDAVILGGETGPCARPMHPDWVRSIRDQCAAAGVDLFFKQWGEYFEGTKMGRGSKKLLGRLLDGRTHDELPWITTEGKP